MNNNPKYILVHCSAVDYNKVPVQFFAINNYHKTRGFPKSSFGYHGGYHVLAEKSGVERRYREDWEVGAHCNKKVDGVSMNYQSLAIGFAGHGDIQLPTQAQIDTIRKRINKWCARYNIPKTNVFIVPHRKFTPWKSCYGTLLSDDWAFRLVEPKKPLPYEVEAAKKIEALHEKIDIIKQMILALTIMINKLLGDKKRRKHPPKVD